MSSIKQLCALGLLGLSLALVSADLYALSVQKTLQKQGCLKCHAISRDKEGPSIKQIAAKYRDDAEAKDKLRTHLRSAAEIKIEGRVEKHKEFEARSEQDLAEVIRWILSH